MADTPWGAIIEGGSNIISSGIQALTQPTLRQQRKSQQKYDRWYQENVTEKNMALENQYAIDAENRQNAYNDPSAVAQRYRNAGLSPQAMLSGASGAGIQAQMGDTPDAGGSGGYSPKPMAVSPDLSGLGEMYNQSKRLENDTKVAEAQAYKLRKEGDRLSGQESRDSDLFSVLKREKELGNDILELQRDLQEALFDNNVEESEERLKTIRQTLENKKSEQGLTDMQKKWYEKSIGLIDKQVENTEADTENKKAVTKTENRLRSLRESQFEAGIISVLRDLDLKGLDYAKNARSLVRLYRNLPEKESQNIWETAGWLANSLITVVSGNLTDDESLLQLIEKRSELEEKLRKKFGLSE